MSANPIAEVTVLEAPATVHVAQVLVCLPTLSDEARSSILQAVYTAFPDGAVLIASPNAAPSQDHPALELVPYKSDRSDANWVLAAGDYAAAAGIAAEHGIQSILLLGDNTAAGDANLLRSMADCIRGKNVDLALPRFNLGPNDGLVNAALLYPLTRALFGADIRMPLPVDAALSVRMAQRLAATAQRQATQGQGSSLLWPVAEAAIAAYSVREIDARAVPPPPAPEGDFNALFSNVAGSLFADIEAKANFWQRARSLSARPAAEPISPSRDVPEVSHDVQSMIESFHLAQTNLQEIWSLVLPPQTRLELKRLSALSTDVFAVSPSLWARIVYDFVLAFHLRTLNRGHLLGAMTPLYLAWVASHLRTTADDPALAARAHAETAIAFETEKPYLVSRWRWPDRFNP